jgi:FkbM family methyltransferase
MLPTAAALIEKLPRVLRRHRLMTAWMKLTGEDPIQLVRIRDDAFGYADMSDGFLRLIVIDKHYDEDFFLIADRMLAGGGTFLDVGANYGLLSFGLAGRHGAAIDFHLFEPNPALVNTISRTKALYPAMRCTLNAVAVSDKAGSISFAINEAQSGASHIAVHGERGVEVPAITLDSYIDENGLADIGLLKLDVEGFELPALRGASRSLIDRRVKAVYFEYFEKYLVRVGPPGEVVDFLDSVGFVTCFGRVSDCGPRGGATHTIAAGRPGHGLKLLPVAGHERPPMTDCLAVPHESLLRL